MSDRCHECGSPLDAEELLAAENARLRAALEEKEAEIARLRVSGCPACAQANRDEFSGISAICTGCGWGIMATPPSAKTTWTQAEHAYKRPHCIPGARERFCPVHGVIQTAVMDDAALKETK